MRTAWALSVILLAACDDDVDPVLDASARDVVVSPRLDATANATADATADATATLDASPCSNGRASDGGCNPSCDGVDCGDGYACVLGACTGVDCVRVPLCTGVFDDCSHCRADTECKPLDGDVGTGCGVWCESVRARCEPACATDELCMWHQPACDGGTCDVQPRCYRRASCETCAPDACAWVWFVDGYDLSYCVVP